MPKKPTILLGRANARNASTYTVDGVTDTLQGWATRLGCTYHTLYKRICLYGRSPEEAIRAGGKHLWRKELIINGETHTIAEWGRKMGIDPDNISERMIRNGWTPEEAVGLKKHVNPQERRVTYRGKTRRVCEWARELGIGYETFRRRLYLNAAGRLSRRAVFMKGNLEQGRIVHKHKYQNWYRGKRLKVAEIARRKGCSSTWIQQMFRAGYTTTQILDDPVLAPCRDYAEISRRQQAAMKRNSHLRELKRMGLLV